MIRVASLFSGAGGADLGMLNAGLEIVFANDNNEDACSTYGANFGADPWDYAIQHTKSEMIPDCDVIIGGPPCQSFSNAKYINMRTGGGLDNVVQMQRIVKDKQPKLFVCENVDTLFDPSMDSFYRQFFMGFTEAGYHVNVYTLNASDYGIPQNRNRIFFFGVRNDLYLKGMVFSRPKTNHWKNEWSGWADYLDLPTNYTFLPRANNLVGISGYNATTTILGTETPYIINGMLPLRMRKVPAMVRDMQLQKLGLKGRYMTIEEMARLQGFPSDFYFCGNTKSVIKQIGNAWCVCVGEAIGKEIRRTLGGM